MYEDPEETPSEDAADALTRAKDKFDQFRMHAEFAAVFEGTRKFDAELRPDLDPEIARDIQRTIARLEKNRMPDTPVLKPEVTDDVRRILNLPDEKNLSTNDYHIHRGAGDQAGEVIILRWLAGEQVDSFYTRLQAHFEAALNQFREEERQSKGWKQDPDTLDYLQALDNIKVQMADRYLRDVIREHRLFVLSTQAADELDILHLTDYVMGATAADVVGEPSAPPEDGATEQDRSWFFKLFSLRGMVETQERMCFFTYLQKSDEQSW